MKQISGNNSQQIQAETVNVGLSYSDVKLLCKDLIQTELDMYKQNAMGEAERRFNEISDKLLDRLRQLDDSARLRFQEPSIQFAANETFKEYIRSGNDNLSDDLIDLMIERIQVDEHTTKQALIDEARQILPKLSSSSISILAIITFTKLVFHRSKEQFIDCLHKMKPVIEQLGTPNSMDIAYLEQVRCGQSLSFATFSSEFVETMERTYPLLFAHPFATEEVNNVINEKKWYERNVALALAFSSLFKNDGNKLIYKQTTISERFDGEIIDALKKLQVIAKKYTHEEILAFFLNVDEKWENVFTLFHRPDIKSFIVSPVGYYIGSRKLTKVLGEDVPISLFYS